MYRGLVVGTTVFVALGLGASPSFADTKPPPPVVVSGDNHDGDVTTVVNAPGHGGGLQPVSSRTSVVVCKWTLDDVDNTVLLQGADPGSFDAGSASSGGLYYNVSCSDGSYYPGIFVPGSTPGGPAPTPGSLARQAMNRLPLPTPAVRHNPSGDALVNLATWWWVDPRQWRPLTQRTAAGPVWARVTARPVKSVWDAGDGTTPLTCRGAGTPYDTSKPASSQSTDCSHTYTESSAKQPQTGADPNDRFFTVTVTVYWQVTFVGTGGAGGALPVMTRTSQFPLRVDERQTVVTGGSG